jgi:hypothetical protein
MGHANATTKFQRVLSVMRQNRIYFAPGPSGGSQAGFLRGVVLAAWDQAVPPTGPAIGEITQNTGQSQAGANAAGFWSQRFTGQPKARGIARQSGQVTFAEGETAKTVQVSDVGTDPVVLCSVVAPGATMTAARATAYAVPLNANQVSIRLADDPATGETITVGYWIP